MASMITTSYDAAMNLLMQALQMNVLPDFLLRWGVRKLLKGRLKEISKPTLEAQLQDLLAFVQYIVREVRENEEIEEYVDGSLVVTDLPEDCEVVQKIALKQMPIAVHTEDANAQHYEVPTKFYELVLGNRLKYSSAYFPKKSSTLDEAEDAMLEIYAKRAQLKDGQSVLDLGCGWGSLTIFLAQKYPNSKVTGVSNSETQKAFISEECRKQGLSNVSIITCDINCFNIDHSFDRILSIEMFEHMKNYQNLLRNVSSWLKPDGLLFIHIFVHKSIPYHFEDKGEDDWMSRNFFTGGTMPSNSLLLYFQEDVSILNHWFMNGMHYAQTSEAWLKKMDSKIKVITPIFTKTYGEAEVTKWIANWRTFFIAVAEMFAYNNGEEWGVAHYLFKKKGT